jgi:hypothetical protein
MTIQCGRLQLERYVCGELETKHADEIKKHLEDCNDCSKIVTKLEIERAAFLQKHPFATFTRAHAPLVQLPWYRRISKTVTRPSLFPVYGVLIVTIAIAPYIYKSHNSADQIVRFKGKNTISYIYKRNGVTRQGTASEKFSAGDRLQILYSSSKQHYMSLLSVDTHGTISFYHPDNKSSTCCIPIATGSEQTYPASIELDETPGAELIIALFSDAPLSTQTVSSWVKKKIASDHDLARLPAVLSASSQEMNAEISTLLLKKE